MWLLWRPRLLPIQLVTRSHRSQCDIALGTMDVAIPQLAINILAVCEGLNWMARL